MIDLELKSIKANNILCFEDIEICFQDYGKTVQIIGENLDVPRAEDGRPASNGAGKSSVQDLISIGFYGKMVKKPKANKAQDFIKEGCDEGVVEICWNNCRVVRTYKRKGTNKLQMWESKDHVWDKDTDITQNVSETQKEILKRVHLTHEAFCNVVIFDDSRDYDFLEADAKLKREIVENLLGLEKYRLFGETAKEKLKLAKLSVGDLTQAYERIQISIETCNNRIAKIKAKETEWRANKDLEIKRLYQRFKEMQKKLESTDDGAALKKYEETQNEIEILEIDQEKDKNKRAKLEETVKDAQAKLLSFKQDRDNVNIDLQGHLVNLKSHETKLLNTKESLKKLEDLEEGASCPVCHAIISQDNYGHALSHEQNTVEGLQSQIEKTNILIVKKREEYGKKSAVITKVEEMIGKAQSSLETVSENIKKRSQKITDLRSVSKPDGDSETKILEAEISEVKRHLTSMKSEIDGNSPYKEMLDDADEEKVLLTKSSEDKKNEVKEAEKLIPYYSFWVKAFGDKGIRKYVVDGIIPSLNNRVAFWMEHLIDGIIEIKFDNQLDATITRNGQLTKYSLMSNGEKQRVNLAISQSFAHIMMINSGAQPSLIFLDEVTGSGIDRAGVLPVYNMIFELAKERQVFVTTHNDHLMNMLDGGEKIVLRKQNDTTQIVS